jgi:molybdopterin guanine dinucleotide-containing S/N-oxide reductase-like protein
MAKRKIRGNTVQGEKTTYKNLGFCSFGIGANAAAVDVKNGRLLRIRPLHFDEKYGLEDMKPWKIEARGKTFEPTMKSLLPPFSLAYKKRAYSPNRILYPLKRIDWDPEGARNTQNRGKSKFVRISWDEAARLVAGEIRRIHEVYGPSGILAQADGHGETQAIHGPHGCQTRLLNLLGGYTLQVRNADSWEGWYWGAKHVWGQDPVGQGTQTNLWKDISENTDMLLFWGCDPETTTWGWSGQQASRLCYFWSELGIKTIYICPDLNYGAAVHADKWIPVRPNTDTALQLAIAYTWITEGTYDKEYVETHTYGFEEFQNYLLGGEDGVPKTAKWAAEICGVPSRIIKALARQWAKKATTIAHGNGGSYIRASYSTEPARMEVILLGMQGLGKPGRNQVKMIEWGLFGLNDQVPGPRSAAIPSVEGAFRGWMFELTPQFIPKTLIPDAILNPPLMWYGTSYAGLPREDQFVSYKYPADGCSEIHMIWTDTPCWETCWNSGNRLYEAMRDPKIECIVAQHPWLENDCLLADIILPVNTKFEQMDFGVDQFSGQFNTVLYEGQSIASIGESKSPYEAVGEIAKQLGLYEQYTEGMDYEQLIHRGFEHSGIADMVSYEEFREKEYFVIPTADKWQDDPPGFFNFYCDPEGNPLKTPTGKLEFYSTGLKEHFGDDDERPPLPHFIPYGESHQESLLHPRAQKYPFLLVSNHPRWRVHANHDDISWLREISTCKVKGPDGYYYEPVWIHPSDAKRLGIESGDVVKLFNERGGVLGGAYVTERIMPGVVYQDHGARVDPIAPGVLDRGGSNNLICPSKTTSRNAIGMVCSGFLVGIEQADLGALRKQYPEAFQRPYDRGSGLRFEAWIEGGDR